MFNIERMELARKRRRLTAKALCERAGISPVTFSRVRNGLQNPDQTTVDKVVAALKFPREFFFLDDLDPIDPDRVNFRSLTAMKAGERDAAVAAASLAFAVSDWLKTRYDLPSADLIDWSQERDPAGAARALRQKWSLGEKPIAHMIRLLEAKGVRVFSLAENTKNVDAFSCWRGGEPYIFLNTFKTTERSRFDAAHELGHLVLHRHGGSEQGREAEAQANEFASSFLMPSADVLAVIPKATRLNQLVSAKKRWKVSLAALAYRLNKLSAITEWQYRTFCIQINRNFGDLEPESFPREISEVWRIVLEEMWQQGRTRNHIADELHIPHEELENLLFGLTAGPDINPPERGRSALRIVD